VLAEKDCSNGPRQRTEYLRLKEDILLDYDTSVRPVIHHSSQTLVYVAMFLRSIDFVSDELRNSKTLMVMCLIFFCNPILFAICTSTFSKLCKNVYSGM
jgi:hypothetical protein